VVGEKLIEVLARPCPWWTISRLCSCSPESRLPPFSDDMPMTDLLDALTSCPLWDDASNPCQMHYPDLYLKAPSHKPVRKR
jgi:hypothetical protein